jgi:hypothetical protein
MINRRKCNCSHKKTHVNIPVIVLSCTECVRYTFNRVDDRAGEVVRRVRFVLTARAVMGGVIEPGVRVVKGDGEREGVRKREMCRS